MCVQNGFDGGKLNNILCRECCVRFHFILCNLVRLVEVDKLLDRNRYRDFDKLVFKISILVRDPGDEVVLLMIDAELNDLLGPFL